MSDNFTITEQLVRYLDNELDGVERAQLEQQLREDSGMQDTLEGLRIAKQSIYLYGLRQTVADIHKELMPEIKQAKPMRTGIVRSITRWSVRVAAAAVIIIAGTIGYQYATVSSEKLFNDSYQSYEASAVRGENSTGLKQLYTAHNMQEVIEAFSKQSTHTVEDYYLAGNAYLQTNNASQAIIYFKAAQQENATNNTAVYAEDIEYYLALAYLKNNEPSLALPLFTAIHNNTQHAYHDKISSWQLTKLGWLTGKK